MAEILFSFDVWLCVSVLNGPVNRTSWKRLKLRTSNLTCMFPGTVRIRLLIFSKKGTWPAWPGSRNPLNFWALNANNSKRIKAIYGLHIWQARFDRQSGHVPVKIFEKAAWPNRLFTWRGYAPSRAPSMICFLLLCRIHAVHADTLQT